MKALDTSSGSGTGPIIQGQEYTGFLYELGQERTFYLRGSEVTASLYYSGGTETVRLQGSEYTRTLYTKSGNSYTMVTIPLFREGSSRTFYKRGSLYSSALFNDGGATTIREQGALFTPALFYAGTRRANLTLAEFTVKKITALGTGQ